MHRLFGCVDHLPRGRYFELVLFSIYCWQTLELDGVASVSLGPRSLRGIEVHGALLYLPLELDSVLEEFVPAEASLAIILVV